MRFVLGMMIGAAAVLVLAEGAVSDVRWQERAAELGQRALALLERPAGAVAESADGADGRSRSGAPAAVPAEAPPASDPRPERTVADSAAPARPGSAPAHSPIARPPDPLPQEEPGQRSPEADASAGSSVAGQVDSEALLAAAEPAAEPERDPAPDREPDPRTLPDAGPAESQPVWVPFHSEMSASGFAERLSTSLDHPFRVERRGPGRYQVVFGYTDEPERQALLAEAARVTGLPL